MPTCSSIAADPRPALQVFLDHPEVNVEIPFVMKSPLAPHLFAARLPVRTHDTQTPQLLCLADNPVCREETRRTIAE
jgi:hypothetical protein